jgi:hypothetical protein
MIERPQHPSPCTPPCTCKNTHPRAHTDGFTRPSLARAARLSVAVVRREYLRAAAAHGDAHRVRIPRRRPHVRAGSPHLEPGEPRPLWCPIICGPAASVSPARRRPVLRSALSGHARSASDDAEATLPLSCGARLSVDAAPRPLVDSRQRSDPRHSYDCLLPPRVPKPSTCAVHFSYVYRLRHKELRIVHKRYEGRANASEQRNQITCFGQAPRTISDHAVGL